MSNLYFHFKHRTTIQVFALSICGKTKFVLRILKEHIVKPFPTPILWVLLEWQPNYEQARAFYPYIEFVGGWTDKLNARLRQDEKNLLIIDEQMAKAGDSKTLSNLFTKGAHPTNFTAIYLIKNVYNKTKSQRTVSVNTHYIMVFRNERNASPLISKCTQAMPPGPWML